MKLWDWVADQVELVSTYVDTAHVLLFLVSVKFYEYGYYGDAAAGTQLPLLSRFCKTYA